MLTKKIISRRVERRVPDRVQRVLGIREFYNKRTKILIWRNAGGLGDILMHRMLFKDFKQLLPEAEIHFACPRHYHSVVTDHPYVDQVLDSTLVDKSDYLISYNTTSACNRYEMLKAPYADLHRADIWATHCGLRLTSHEMHFRLTEQEQQRGRQLLESQRNLEGPIVLIAPVASTPQRSLLPSHLQGLWDWFKGKPYCPVGIHQTPIPFFEKQQLPQVCHLTLREWLATVQAADYVISVDTSTFHCAGGFHKPLVGIFTNADGKVYGKHFRNFELVQLHRDTHPEWTCGPCYDWCSCIKTKLFPKPCLTELPVEMIIRGVEKLLTK